MPQPIYSHRIQAILQHVVVELGLTLTLSDNGGQVSLAENQEMFRSTADLAGVDVSFAQSNGVNIYTFHAKNTT